MAERTRTGDVGPRPAEAGGGARAGSERFRRLPERVDPDDLVAMQEVDVAPDPTMGRDPDRDFMLRNAGG